MKGLRVFLIEHLDVPGADPADLRSHLAALRTSGAAVRTALVAPESHLGPDGAGARPVVPPPLRADRQGARVLAARMEEAHPDLVLLASAADGGGALAHQLPHGLEARWWPTGLCDPTDAATLAEAGLLALPGGEGERTSGAVSRGDGSGSCAALEWSMVETCHGGRASLPLWDGRYLLAPAPLAGEGGRDAVAGFATVAETRDELDLVVLADPQPEFEQLARDLGIGMRVHFAGPARREAEHAWFAAAAAALFASAGFSGGLVLRALARGCPVLPLGAGRSSARLAGWLAARGALPVACGSGADAVAAALETVLVRGVAVTRAIGAGREGAALHTAEALATQFRVAFESTAPRREAPAA